MMNTVIKNKIDELNRICMQLNVQKLYIFGSVATNNHRLNSDIDFLISFSETLSVEEYTNNYFAMRENLQQLFHREIDLVTQRSLNNPYLIESIEESKQLIYEA